MVEPFTNRGDPEQMPHSVASDLGLHCLPVTLLGVSRLQWVNFIYEHTCTDGQSDQGLHFLFGRN